MLVGPDRRCTAGSSSVPHPRPIVVLTSLTAEGTPRLVLELCRIWQPQGIRPIVALLRAKPDDLAPEFDALGIERVCLGMGERGYARYGRLALALFRLARRHRADALLSMPLGWHAFMAYGARLGGVRRVVAHVGNYPTMHGAALQKFRALVRLGRPATTALVCCSRYVQDGVVDRLGVDPARDRRDLQRRAGRRLRRARRRGPPAAHSRALSDRHGRPARGAQGPADADPGRRPAPAPGARLRGLAGRRGQPPRASSRR